MKIKNEALLSLSPARILKDDIPNEAIDLHWIQKTVNDTTFKSFVQKKREDFFHQAAAIASLMKMYGDHHILYHLWHDWLPKVYHCNRWCPWHCHYCPFIILICPPAHPNSSSDGQQSPNFTWLASIYTQHNKSVQNEFPFQFYVNLECMNCCSDWLID